MKPRHCYLPVRRVREGRDGTALPGQRGAAGRWQVNPSHLSRLLGVRKLPAGQVRRAADRTGLPIAPGSFIGAIRGRLDSRPWRDHPITVDEIQDLVRYLTAACFNTTFAGPGGARPTPPDPARHIHARRFRRILSA